MLNQEYLPSSLIPRKGRSNRSTIRRGAHPQRPGALRRHRSRPGRPRGRRPGRPAAQGRRCRRGKMTVSKDELAKMRETMTGKAIAQKLGVSMGTVTNHLKKHGLTGNRGRPAKKK